MNCLLSGAIVRIGGAQKRADGVAGAKYSKDKMSDDIIGCFEYEYEKDGVNYMDIYVHAASTTKADAYSAFN